MKILITDDSESVREMLGMLIKDWGYQPVFAKDGEEAWSILIDDSPPRVAMVDWMMPRMDGLDLCKKIKTSPNLPFFYVVLITAKSSVEDVITGLEAGADDFLSKPVSPEELRSRLEVGARILGYQDKIFADAHKLEMEIAERKHIEERMNAYRKELEQSNDEKSRLLEEIKDLKKG